MGFLDKLKKKKDEDDDDLDELDTDATATDTADDGDEDDDEAPSGGGLFGRASGLLGKVKKLSSGGDGDGGGGIGSLLGKVKSLRGGNSDSDDSDLDDDDIANDELDAGQDDEEGEQPIRRSGIAAALDGNSDAAESSKEEADKEEIPVALTAGSAPMDLGSLFEEEFVFDPTLKDLAESLDDVSAVELAADLRTFLDELQ